jgi:hypothetical protein
MRTLALTLAALLLAAPAFAAEHPAPAAAPAPAPVVAPAPVAPTADP